MSSSRQLAAIMFTDIVGYTALMGKDSNKALELIRISKDIQKPLVEKHNGKWLKEMGDGAMAQFSTALDAVNCSIEIQEVARAKLDGKLRIGIHSGDITIEDDDVYGDGVNVASRLESIADPGGIYISESIEKAIQGQTNVQAKYLGEVKLKNVAYGVRTYALQGVGLPVPEVKAEKQVSGHFMAELKRRGVFRAGATYVVLSLLVILIVPYASSMIDLPQGFSTALFTVLIVGLPIALYLAWNYERSPEGFVRTTSQQSWQNPYKPGQRKPLTGNFIIVGLVLVIIVMYAYPRYFTDGSNSAATTNDATDNSIAVLYFDNMSGDPNQEYFSDGMTEEIIAQLSRIKELDVRSRTSVIQYKVKREQMSLREIGQELGVKTILEGSVRKSGNKIKVTAQLIDAITDEHLWSEIYDADFKDIFEVQSSIAKKIAEKFDITIDADIEMQLNTPPTLNMEAYDMYLRARNMSFDEWGFGKPQPRRDSAAIILKEVIGMDPKFSDAYALLSEIYSINNWRVEYRKNWEDSALILAHAAITYNSKSPWGYMAMGNFHSYANQPEQATEWFLKANAIDPSLGLTDLGNSYLWSGDYLKSLMYFRQAIARTPLEVDGHIGLMWLYFNLGILDSARSLASRARDISPESYKRSGSIFLYHIGLEEWDQAFEAQKQRFAQNPRSSDYGTGIIHLYRREYDLAKVYYLKSDYRDLDWGLILWKEGLIDSATAVFERAINYRMAFEENFDPWHPYDISRAYAAMGKVNEFMKYARLAFELGWHEIRIIEQDPFLDEIRDTPEFKQIEKEFYEKNKQLRKEVLEAASKPLESPATR